MSKTGLNKIGIFEKYSSHSIPGYQQQIYHRPLIMILTINMDSNLVIDFFQMNKIISVKTMTSLDLNILLVLYKVQRNRS